MSLFDPQGPPLPNSVDGPDGHQHDEPRAHNSHRHHHHHHHNPNQRPLQNSHNVQFAPSLMSADDIDQHTGSATTAAAAAAAVISSSPGSGSSSSVTTTSIAQPPELDSLDPHLEARAIVRALQCQQCSLPLRKPMTLPCGNSLCLPCLPELHRREHITYPFGPNRQEGFVCPFDDCRQEHSLDDCSQDVTLSKIMERVCTEVALQRTRTPNTPVLLEEKPSRHTPVTMSPQMVNDEGTRTTTVDLSADDVSASATGTSPQSRSRVLNGGRLLATFTLAELGELHYESEVSYQTMHESGGETYQYLDKEFLEQLKGVARIEMDCQLCYTLMLDPLTTPCGHTFCRKCVARVLEHADSCPVCRRPLRTIQPGVVSEPSNKRLSKLLLTLCPEQVSQRARAIEAEEELLRVLRSPLSGSRFAQRLPLFVCTLAYPSMPTFLHIFEPRYRLMIRRARESGDNKFGMLMYNARGESQGQLGRTPFMQYGTLLHIESMQLLADGRSIIETKGVSRFRVLRHEMLDGYAIGDVERVDDVPVAEEEALEAQEVSRHLGSSSSNNIPFPPSTTSTSATGTMNGTSSANRQHLPPLESLTTLELLRIGTDFVSRMRSASAPWLSNNYTAAYGPMPDHDPALFPYWFASVLPIHEAEKYRLLPTRSVRERLKITAGWARHVEGMSWFSTSSCSVL